MSCHVLSTAEPILEPRCDNCLDVGSITCLVAKCAGSHIPIEVLLGLGWKGYLSKRVLQRVLVLIRHGALILKNTHEP